MNKPTRLILAFLLLVITFSSAKAQFIKAFQWELTLGGSQAASKLIATPDGENYEIGMVPLAQANTTFWYNLNRSISLGVNGSFLTKYFSFNENDKKDVKYSGLSLGPLLKYNFLEKKKLKLFVAAGLTASYHDTWVPTYYAVYTLPGLNEFVYEYRGRENVSKTTLGGDVKVGVNVHFTNSFGMLMQGGYQNNSYYKGPMANLGFFFAFKSK